ncbi:MAG TPA: hypothetical protein VGR57_04350 [Ktedonobacterales bacterium]|nr:hypothetical protein [Ktedonobacterales bacterium]
MAHIAKLWSRPLAKYATTALLLAVLVGSSAYIAFGRNAHASAPDTGCHLNSARGDIQHVIYVQFDNVHFTRDTPNVPSDLEQMPNLKNFIEQNGTMLTDHHTPLIAHTANDILTSFTGLYGNDHGVPIANSFRYFNPNGSSNLGVSFAYWTDPLFDPNTSSPTDTKFNMLAADGKSNTPAPWVPFTRAGCNFGGVSTANVVLENIATDIPTVFGAGSPEASEVTANPTKAFTDFVGIGVHCAAGNALCSAANNGKSDRLPDEPGGYNGYNALFGAKYVDPQISPSGPLTDLNGNVIKDPAGNVGFPGFDGMPATVSLSYVAAMQEHGVPVTYAYISDAHDNHPSGPAFGPGQFGYVQALKAYDEAFGKFFTRLANDGINQSNTLFVFTSDEGDHFAGGPGSPAGCDGVTTPCTYSKIGEANGNLAGLLATEQGVTTPFKVHSDSAPNFYITGNPARDAAVTRTFDRAVGALTAVNPITGHTENITNFLADPVEMNLLHMITSDPARTPTLTMFAKPDYFLFAGAPNCISPCVTEQPGFAWNHGDVAPDINITWLGLVGPGVRTLGDDGSIWSDHTDIRPTMLMLLGLHDDYATDGRALVEPLFDWAVPQTWRAHRETLLRLAATFKQLNAAVGQFGLQSLVVSTRALESNAAGDATYTDLENQLAALGKQRDTLAGQMRDALSAATFGGQALNEQDAQSLIDQGQSLLASMSTLASN